ncbi:MAG: ribokinase [Pseudomonadota bacterium]
MSIAVFGSVNVDVTLSVKALPRPGETIHATRQSIGLGGKGTNQAVAAQRLTRGSVRLSAAIGADANGSFVRDLLAQHDLSLDWIETNEEVLTGTAMIHVDAHSQNAITVFGGANMAWRETGPDASVFDGAKAALFQLETPLEATLSAMRAARAAGAVVVLDPAPVPAAPLDALLAEAEVITPNETEAEALLGRRVASPEDAMRAAGDLRAFGPRLAIVKLGAQGLAYDHASGASGFLPAFPVKAVDTVAAGDCFNGALAVAFAERMELVEALRFAAAAGALAVTRTGAAAAAPFRSDVDQMLAPFGGLASSGGKRAEANSNLT